jgi:hypothetical protein
MSKRYELLKEWIYVNGGNGEIVEAGTVLTKSEKDGSYYRLPSNNIVWHELVENNPSWFKPIEDKEPTAFQWSDELVMRFVEYFDANEWIGYEQSMKEFKELKLSQSIPAGTGTANETINDWLDDFTKKVIDTKPPTDNPVLDRNDKGIVEQLNEAESKMYSKQNKKEMEGLSEPWLGYKEKWSRKRLLDLIEFTRAASPAYGIVNIYDQFIATDSHREPERWDLMWSEGKIVLHKSPHGKWLLVEYDEERKVDVQVMSDDLDITCSWPFTGVTVNGEKYIKKDVRF